MAIWQPQYIRNTAEYQEAATEAERRNRIEEAQEKERREKEKAEETAKLKEWAIANGSVLLKARLAGEFEWESLARREYCQTVIGSLGFTELKYDAEEYPEVSISDRTTPTLEEIHALNSVQEQLGVRAKAKLVWVKYSKDDSDEDGSDEDDSFARTEIEVAILCPDGVGRTHYLDPQATVVA